MSEIKTMPLWEALRHIEDVIKIETVYLYDQVTLELIDIVDTDTAKEDYAYRIVRKYETNGNTVKMWLI